MNGKNANNNKAFNYGIDNKRTKEVESFSADFSK
jgi:hypothetical protein